MKTQETKVNIKNILIYVLGFFLIGLGVNLMNKSDLGMGAWDTVTFNIHGFLINTMNMNPNIILVGYVSIVIAFIVMFMVILYRRDVKFLFMTVPVLLVGNVINFWKYVVFDSFTVNALTIQVLFFILGALLIPFALALVVKSSFPAFVFDEWTFMMADIFKTKNFGKVRLGIEILGITIGIIFGFLGFYHLDGTLGTVNVGSIIVAFTFGPTMAFYLNILGVTKKDRS